MRKTIFVIIILTSAGSFSSGCSKSDSGGVASCDLSVSFNANIKRILDVNCSGCHSPGSGYTNAIARWAYDGTYNSAFSRRSDISAQVAAGMMPQNGSLPASVRDSIGCWNTKNAPN